ncbi:carbamoyltransferase C-terminal domain-containing protein [Polluticaenibacter yanchengensis]|uniref:Glycosyltransferase n=1 Tax=Polluticaenibacter yanchengensis TaxID=3014562 RepID=A0ABT4UHW3_9BACT|nr:glycosyltransferase [Chitinophagaceae bacterium LY-5]
MTFKILHISPYYLPDTNFGGPTFSVSSLCEALVKSDVEVTVFTVSYHKEDELPKKAIINGVNVVYFKGDFGTPCQWSQQLLDALKKEAGNYDIVHLNTWWNLLIFKSLAIVKSLDIPIVISLRGMLGQYSFTHRKTLLKKVFQEQFGNKLLNSATILATSKLEADEVNERTGRPLKEIPVLPNLINLKIRPTMTLGNQPGFKIGFLSRLHHKKGIDNLLQAIPGCPHVDEVIIGGDGDEIYVNSLKDEVNRLGIAHKVNFVGWISDDMKTDFFQTFDIFVLPSYHENFANVVAEAWGAGKPTIITPEVGLSNFVEQYDVGWLCEATPESTAAVINQAFNEKHLWERKAANAQQLAADKFTNDRIINDYMQLYKKIANSKRTNIVLGINAYHADASAAIYKNGELLAAVEEERFTRVKHFAGFPKLAIDFCLKEAGVNINQVDAVTFGRDPQAKFANKLKFALAKPKALQYAIKGRLSNAQKSQNVTDDLRHHFPESADTLKHKIHFIEHHRSHLASAYFASPFRHAALLSVDGSGDFTTTMLGVGKDLDISVIDDIDFPHSIGIFYSAFTQLLGFPHYGDEYKVMGLAPYGKPVYNREVEQVIQILPDGKFKLNLEYFRAPEKGYVHYNEDHVPVIPVLYSRLLEEKFGVARKKEEPLTEHHKNLAASVQAVTEKVIFHLLNHLHQLTGLTEVCIAGGVAQNSVANGKIYANTPFKKVYIPPAGHDAGLSMGSALYYQHHILKQERSLKIASPYTGTYFSNAEIATVIKANRLSFNLYSKPELYEAVANCITDGGVVGWFSGKSEFGPRALGNRSILADPRRADAKDIINSKIKRRESFRPFAPSILQEHVTEYFEQTADVPYMEKVFVIKADKRALIPAVTHADGTGRLQTVTKDINENYYNLIETLFKKTGVPVILNTSFNENEPIVNTPQQAIDCFLRTSMDMLVLEDFVITRKDIHS